MEELVLADCTSVDQFVWQKHLRFTMDEVADQTVVLHHGTTYHYGHEFLSYNRETIVITPVSSQTFLSISAALSLHSGVLLTCSSGKTETLRSLADHLGVYLVLFNCSQ